MAEKLDCGMPPVGGDQVLERLKLERKKVIAMKTFAEVESDFVRQKVLPDFAFEQFDQPSRINPLRAPVREAQVAIVTTAGAYIDGNQPSFALGKEGDASFREIPADVSPSALKLSHVGYDTRRAIQDLSVVFPLERLHEVKEAGEIGSIAPRHFSFMGYSPRASVLMDNAREVGGRLLADSVDLVLLVPA